MATNPVGNARFYTNTGPHALAVVAATVGCEAPESDLLLSGLASLDSAERDQLSFVSGTRHAPMLEQSRAGAILVSADLQGRVPSGTVALVVDDPMASWAEVAALFHPPLAPDAGIHRMAVVAETATVDPSAEIAAFVHIGPGAVIGARCQIGLGAVIGSGVVLGPDCRVGPNACISHAVLGARVYVYPGARIGQEGFGFSITASGFRTTPQLCGVILGDDVEVGANATIDRGALRETVIGAGTRIDNQVQIAHGVRIGRYCAIAALAGISGSAEIGDFVVMGGQVGVAEHVTIGRKSKIGAQSGVMSKLEAGAVVVGSSARPARQVFREIAVLRRLAQPRSTGG